MGLSHWKVRKKKGWSLTSEAKTYFWSFSWRNTSMSERRTAWTSAEEETQQWSITTQPTSEQISCNNTVLGSSRAGFANPGSKINLPVARRSKGSSWRCQIRLALNQLCIKQDTSAPRHPAGFSLTHWSRAAPLQPHAHYQLRHGHNSESQRHLFNRSSVFSNNQYFSPEAKYLRRKFWVLWFSWWVVCRV